MKEADFPALYEAADIASKSAQKSFFLALGAYLSCLIVAAFMSVVDYRAPWFYLVQAGILLSSLGITIFLAHTKPQRAWYAGRALAESVKTVTWRYMMRAEPYQNNDAREHFVRSLRKIFDANKQASASAVEMTGVSQITASMDAVRARGLDERKQIYMRERVEEQLVWYKTKAVFNKKSSRVWFGCLIALNVAAVSFAFARSLFVGMNYWPTEIFLALAGAGMTWLQTKRFQELAASYALTTHEISFLKETFPRSKIEQDFSAFVGDAENAFSREHTQWQARRDED